LEEQSLQNDSDTEEELKENIQKEILEVLRKVLG
jgi:hypothetical protein